jgi:hypothetical protein
VLLIPVPPSAPIAISYGTHGLVTITTTCEPEPCRERLQIYCRKHPSPSLPASRVAAPSEPHCYGAGNAASCCLPLLVPRSLVPPSPLPSPPLPCSSRRAASPCAISRLLKQAATTSNVAAPTDLHATKSPGSIRVGRIESMDPANIFHQGLGTVPPRHHQPYVPPNKPQYNHDDLSDGDGSGHRVAHTLTACCRCRQVAKHDAMRPYRAASLAKGLALSANTWILPQIARSNAPG